MTFRGLVIIIAASAAASAAFAGLDWATGFAGGDWVRDFALAFAGATIAALWAREWGEE